MAQRAFPNPYADYNKSLAEGYFDSAGRLTPEFSQRLNNKIRELLQQMERGLKSADPRDGTCYTGWSGMKHWPACIFYSRLIHLNKIDPHAPNEMLYGRMGYIYALLFVNKHFGEEKIPLSHIQQICETVLTSGESLARKRNFTAKTPLMYEWYQEYYVGAAHGLAGIYYFLMQVGGDYGETLKCAFVDYVCQLKFPSGNYPPCVDDNRDLLVHWCHGAPGVIYMLIQAYKVFREEQYLSDAYRCADVIWQYGLLKKGYGLCHGTAGNAYAFLTLYNLTQDMKYLYRACKFAEWCLDYGEHGCRTPDTPFSLFEGILHTLVSTSLLDT
ncbi:glutathione S-transferase LANCL1 [Trichechus manatus latirostris]|uniref:Glutathione S-transferase LANCL1 n=1 Tax=Trichechus manatus latirostris TaxID=127582 RepID=A0A2Y9QY03_TRIMA|nr:glutathione S-transferase LANCL1 [Trichechus manatus latirostris]